MKNPNRPRIETEFVYPPIPIRSLDWNAAREGWDHGDPLGHGATEKEAINNLLELEEDMGIWEIEEESQIPTPND